MGILLSLFETYIFPPLIAHGHIEFYDCVEREEVPEPIFFDCEEEQQQQEQRSALNFFPISPTNTASEPKQSLALKLQLKFSKLKKKLQK